jgi:hypothetical protein
MHHCAFEQRATDFLLGHPLVHQIPAIAKTPITLLSTNESAIRKDLLRKNPLPTED